MSQRQTIKPTKPADLLQIGDRFGRLAPFTDEEVRHLESALERPLEPQIRAWLLDAMRSFIVIAVKKGAGVPNLRDYENRFHAISDSARVLSRAIEQGDPAISSLVRVELERAVLKHLKTTRRVETIDECQAQLIREEAFGEFLTHLGQIQTAADNAVRSLRAKTSKRGPKEDFPFRVFLRTVTEIARSAGADMKLPRHEDCASDDPDGPRTPLFNFAREAIRLLIAKARGFDGVTPTAIGELRQHERKSHRALLKTLETI